MASSVQSRTMKVLLVVEALCAAFGYMGGVMFFVDPSGKLYGLDVNLAHLPVTDFLLVGLWLFVVYGVGFSLATYALWNRKQWAWIGAVLLSLVWIGWIAVETFLLGISPFIDIWLVPPVLGLLLLLEPGIRREWGAMRRKSLAT